MEVEDLGEEPKSVVRQGGGGGMEKVSEKLS